MQTYRAELHVHTVLSPCAEVEMIPPLIVQEALEHGINLIAITDHNASANVSAVQKAAEHTGLTVLPGMELQTQEEVHLLCLFDTLEQLSAWQTVVDRAMPVIENNIDFFGEQFVVDETGDFIRREMRLLLTSADLSLEQAIEGVNTLGGLPIPAHVDRRAYGLIAQLGFVPPNLPVGALELSRHMTPGEAMQKFPQLGSYPLIQNGDVHLLSQFLGVNEFTIETPTMLEIRQALSGTGNRAYNLLNHKNDPLES